MTKKRKNYHLARDRKNNRLVNYHLGCALKHLLVVASLMPKRYFFKRHEILLAIANFMKLLSNPDSYENRRRYLWRRGRWKTESDKELRRRLNEYSSDHVYDINAFYLLAAKK